MSNTFEETFWENSIPLLKAQSQVLRSKTIFANESPLKMIKNTFYFSLKAPLFSKYLSFCLYILVMYKNGLFRKIRLISKLMTSQPDQQTIAIHIFPNISRRKCNQTIKLGQIIEYNMRNTFVKKSYTKYDEETIPRLFSKKSKLIISLDQ